MKIKLQKQYLKERKKPLRRCRNRSEDHIKKESKETLYDMWTEFIWLTRGTVGTPL